MSGEHSEDCGRNKGEQWCTCGAWAPPGEVYTPPAVGTMAWLEDHSAITLFDNIEDAAAAIRATNEGRSNVGNFVLETE